MYELTIEWPDLGLTKRYLSLKAAVRVARRIIKSNEPPLSAKVTRNGETQWEHDVRKLP